MIPRFTVLIAALVSAPAFAAPCTSVSDATAENVLSCPKPIQFQIFQSAPEMTADGLHGRIFKAVESVYRDYLSAKQGALCLSQQGNWYGAAAKFGVLGHLKDPTCSKAFGNLKTDRKLKSWDGLVLSAWNGTFTDVRYFEMVALKQAYPAIESEASREMNDPTAKPEERTDAFAALTWNTSNASKTQILMDFIREPAISNSDEVGPLASELARVGTDVERVSRTFQDLFMDGRIKIDRKAAIVRASAGFVSRPLSQAYADQLSDYASKCGDDLNAAIFEVFPELSPALEYATAKLVGRCLGSSGQFTNVTAAANAAVRLGMKSIVLPLVDYLNGETDDLVKYMNQRGISRDYQSTFLAAINAIAAFRSERALPTLQSDAYVNSKNDEIAIATRRAIDAIDAGIQVSRIKKADAAAIQWGKDMIRFHNGSGKAVQMEVLSAFKIAMRVKPSTVAGIKAFLRNEIAEGYHAQDPELVAAMQAIAK